jgi:hypothetical protein
LSFFYTTKGSKKTTILVVFVDSFCPFLTEKATDIGCFLDSFCPFCSTKATDIVCFLDSFCPFCSTKATDIGCFLVPTASASERQSNSPLASLARGPLSVPFCPFLPLSDREINRCQLYLSGEYGQKRNQYLSLLSGEYGQKRNQYQLSLLDK